MADPEHVQLLSRGVVGWNAWRAENPGVQPDLSNLARSNANLNWFDLRHLNLQGADFSGHGFLGSSWLQWVLLDGADLAGANLSLANLNGASLRGANLKGALLTGAIFTWTDLSEANLEEVDFESATIVGANFSAANLQGVRFSRSLVHNAIGLEKVEGVPSLPFPFYTRRVRAAAVHKRADGYADELTPEQQVSLLREGVEGWNAWRTKQNLSPANLRGMDLRGLNLDEANLVDADLSGVNLSSVGLRRADLTGAFLKFADLEKADLSFAKAEEADFESARLCGASLQGTFIRKATFPAADLRDVYAQDVAGEESDFLNANLAGARFSGGNLAKAKFRAANLSRCNFSGQTRVSESDMGDVIAVDADFSGSSLDRSDFTRARLIRANLSKAYLFRAALTSADLSFANLQAADLIRADLVGSDLENADISDTRIYGVAAWDLKTNEKTVQNNLIVTWPGEPVIRVDSIELAQFVYLLLKHEKLRDTINAVAERGVLLLGRFGGGGLDVLRAVAEELRKQKYLPMIFDWERPPDRNYTETVMTLVGLSRFVIVDLSGPSVPQELYATVPHFKIPFVPILEEGRKKYAMFADLLENPWVLHPEVRFASVSDLLKVLKTKIIDPAEAMHEKRQRRLAEIFENQD